MTVGASGPVERVVALLSEAGYDPLPQPVEVAGIPFEFSAVLIARSSLDLVVVVDTIIDTDVESIQRRVRGLSRALDLVESRRPLTVVVVGPEPKPELQVALTRIARVLVTGVPSEGRELREAIAVLLPLKLVTVTEMPESWRGARERLLAAHPDAAGLLEAAEVGSDEVAAAVRRQLLGSDADGAESQ